MKNPFCLLVGSGALTGVLSVCLALSAAADVTIHAPREGAVVPTHTAAQKAFLKMPRAERVAKFADAEYRRSLTRGTEGVACGWHPLPVELKWSGAAATAKVTLRRAKDGVETFSCESTNGVACLDNLEIACDYVARVEAAEGAAEVRFRTEDEAPRLLRTRVPSVRDLGGRLGLGGRRVRQNLVFRSAGLNENASAVRSTKDEWNALDTNGVVAAQEPLLRAAAARWASAATTAEVPFVAAKLPARWSYWKRTGLAPVAVHERFFGRAGDEMWDGALVPDAQGRIDLRAVGEGTWALVEGVVEAEADGFASVGCGADWYWMLSVNGVMVRDRFSDGNRQQPVDVSNYTVLLPVKKGANVVRALVGSGSGGCIWAFGPAQPASREVLVAAERTNAAEMLERLYVRSLGYKVGATRIDDDGRAFWLGSLGVKSDIDLRSDRECRGMTGSPLGGGVTWFHYSSYGYGGMAEPAAKAAFAKVFRVFLDRANYPIVFHCIAGQDRTGTVAFLLNGLLGVAEEELYLDWEVNVFRNGNTGWLHEWFDELVKLVDTYPGETLNDRIAAYVRACGFTDGDIARFREIMLEP